MPPAGTATEFLPDPENPPFEGPAPDLAGGGVEPEGAADAADTASALSDSHDAAPPLAGTFCHFTVNGERCKKPAGHDGDHVVALTMHTVPSQWAAASTPAVDGANRYMGEPPPPAWRDADRAAMRRVLADKGFEHALPTLAQGVAVDLVPAHARDLDAKLEATADEIEGVVLDALVRFAQGRGWKRAR